MAELRRDPSSQELLDRIMRQGRDLARLERELAQAREDIDFLNRCCLDLLRARKSDQAKLAEKLEAQRTDIDEAHEFIMRLAEARKNEGADVTDRLSILEDKIFPSMGPMISSIEKIVGGFEGWNLNNPLDHGKQGDKNC